jgi:hypothetical protein
MALKKSVCVFRWFPLNFLKQKVSLKLTPLIPTNFFAFDVTIPRVFHHNHKKDTTNGG